MYNYFYQIGVQKSNFSRVYLEQNICNLDGELGIIVRLTNFIIRYHYEKMMKLIK